MQVNLQTFKELLQVAFFDNNNNKRQQAETFIYQLKDTQLELVFNLCAQIMTNLETPSPLRQAAAQLLKNYMRLFLNSCPTWSLVPQPTQIFVKQSCLSLLVDKQLELRRAGANVIGEICAHDIPKGLWPEIIRNLVHNCTIGDLQIRTSALMTLGYICEGLKSVPSSGINVQDTQTILIGICSGMDKNQNQDADTTVYAIKALRDALSFMCEQFAEINIRNYIWGLLFEQMISNNVVIREIALQTVIDFSRITFSFLPQYAPRLLETTLVSFQADTPIAVPAIEIWSQIAQEIQQNDKSIDQQVLTQTINLLYQFLTEKCQIFLMPLLSNLLITDGDINEGEQFAQLSRQQSSYKLISMILDITQQAAHQILMTFIGNTINHQDPKFRNAACLAFAALSEGEQKESARKILFENVARFAELINDPVHSVSIAALHTLARVAESYPEALINNGRSQQILATIVNTFGCPVKYLLVPVWVIVFLTDSMSKFEGSFLWTNKHQVLSSLAQVAVRADIKDSDLSIIDAAFMGILNIIYTIQDPNSSKQYLTQFMTQIKATFTLSGNRMQHLQSGLLSCIHGCLVRLKAIDLSENEVSDIIQVCMSGQIVQKQDVFYVFAGVAQCLRLQFAPYAAKCLEIISPSLQDSQDADTFKAALFCLSDIARAMDVQFAPYKKILDYLNELILNPGFNRELKLHIYNTLADVLIAVKDECFVYVQNFKKVLHLGMSGCVQLSYTNDINQIDYAERLKEALVGFYQCILHTFCDQNKPHPDLEDTIAPMFQFIQQVCDKSLKPTIEFAKSCINVVFDVANFYHYSKALMPEIKQYITSDFIRQLLQVLNNYRKDKEYAESVDFALEILKYKYNFKLDF
ncbi:hypothetical protein pb186bvf_016621 [Paramecium bursaria]